jgi:putative SOS response-associated peptidase YedK
MCYNVQFIERRIQKYAERYKDVLPADWDVRTFKHALPEYYFVSGFAHPALPVVKHDGIFLYEWGLIPLWSKDSAFANEIRTKTLNAVGETVFETPSFRNCITKKRCLLGINGFFEWREFNKAKYPYFIKTKKNEIFSLGCIYERWVDKSTGEIRDTFSIITTAANPLMEKIHNTKKRMPLIISPENEQKWVSEGSTKDEVATLIKPYNANDLEAYTISKTVNSARNERNVSEITDPVEYPELPPLQLSQH